MRLNRRLRARLQRSTDGQKTPGVDYEVGIEALRIRWIDAETGALRLLDNSST
jgi:hypothetical protein